MRNLLESLKKKIYLIIIYIFNLFPIKKNKIFLFSYYGTQYGCNPKHITEFILNNCPKGRFDIVWAFNDLQSKEQLTGFRKVRTMTLRYFYELCTSKVIITNYRTTDLFVKRKDQYYIQTWHSSLRLKQIEKDAEDSLPRHYVDMAQKDSVKCDLLLSGCKYSTEIFKRSFWYNGKIFEHGTPRNDVLFQNNAKLRTKICQILDIPKDSKVVLYAPTFRKDGKLDIYDLKYTEILKKLQSKFGGEWRFLVRLHPHLIAKSKQLECADNVIDVTAYNDVQELLSISDILISDYSSVVFDFSFTRRPCFLYIPDVMDYVNNDRKLYFDLLQLPFISAGSNDELLEQLEKFDYKKYKYKLNYFLDSICSFESGRASEKLLRHIDKVCFN